MHWVKTITGHRTYMASFSWRSDAIKLHRFALIFSKINQ